MDINNIIISILKLLSIIIFAVAVEKFSVFFLNKVEKKIKQTHITDNKLLINFLSLFRSLIKYLTWIILIILIAKMFNLGFLIEIFAFFSVIIGFLVKEFMLDFVTGFVVVLEKQFSIGDIITVDETQGKVKEIGIRTTILELENKETCIISNHLLKKIIIKKQ